MDELRTQIAKAPTQRRGRANGGGKLVSDHYELKKIDLEHRHARRLPELEFQREKESEKKQKKNDRAREGPQSLL